MPPATNYTPSELAAFYTSEADTLEATDITGWSRSEKRKHLEEIADLRSAALHWTART